MEAGFQHGTGEAVEKCYLCNERARWVRHVGDKRSVSCSKHALDEPVGNEEDPNYGQWQYIGR